MGTSKSMILAQIPAAAFQANTRPQVNCRYRKPFDRDPRRMEEAILHIRRLGSRFLSERRNWQQQATSDDWATPDGRTRDRQSAGAFGTWHAFLNVCCGWSRPGPVSPSEPLPTPPNIWPVSEALSQICSCFPPVGLREAHGLYTKQSKYSSGFKLAAKPPYLSRGDDGTDSDDGTERLKRRRPAGLPPRWRRIGRAVGQIAIGLNAILIAAVA